jgi:hypothetical protein
MAYLFFCFFVFQLQSLLELMTFNRSVYDLNGYLKQKTATYFEILKTKKKQKKKRKNSLCIAIITCIINIVNFHKLFSLASIIVAIFIVIMIILVLVVLARRRRSSANVYSLFCISPNRIISGVESMCSDCAYSDSY